MPEPIIQTSSAQAQVDYLMATPNGDRMLIGNNSSSSVMRRLLHSGFDVNSLRTLDVLSKDEWKIFDDVIIDVARQRLTGVQDLMAAGLSYDIPNGLGTTQVEWELGSDMDPAHVSMDGTTMGQRDRYTYTLKSLPLPIVHKEFAVNIRALEASRKRGLPLDTTQAQLCSKIVSEKLEDMVFNGHAITVAGTTIEGYLNATNRNTGSIVDWALVGTTGEVIIASVLAMITAAMADKMYGPYVLYVPIDYYIKLGNDFKTNSDKTILQRILEIPGISAVKFSQNLPGGGTGKVVLVQMTRDVVDIVNGLPVTTVQWEENGGFTQMFKVMAIMVPRVKYTAALQSGITVFSV